MHRFQGEMPINEVQSYGSKGNVEEQGTLGIIIFVSF